MARSMSLHLGLNSVAPHTHKYSGWDGELIACENDARDMDQLAEAAGVEQRTAPLTADATVGSGTGAVASAPYPVPDPT